MIVVVVVVVTVAFVFVVVVVVVRENSVRQAGKPGIRLLISIKPND